MGGKVWWMVKQEDLGFRLQQNLLTRHYRILDSENYCLYSSVHEDYICQKFKELLEKEK